MEHHKLSARSEKRLAKCHPDLQEVVKLALKVSEVDFGVAETARTMARQKELVAAGASKTMNSRHLVAENGWCHAIDLYGWVAGRADWSWPIAHKIAIAMKESAKALGVKITWGGDWKSFKDGPHYQLDWKAYPGKEGT